MIGREKAQALLERALAALTKAGAEEAHAGLMGGEEGLTRFANNYIHQNVAESGAGLSLVAAIGKKLGGSGTNRLDRAGVNAAARRAVAIAKCAAEDPDFPGLAAAPAAPEVPEGFDAKTAKMNPGQRARIVARATKRAQKHSALAGGKVSSGCTEIAVANSAGARQYAVTSSFAASCSAMIEGSAGSEDWSAGAAGHVAAQARSFGKEAVTTALKARKPKSVEPGEWTVILTPRAAAELLKFLAYLGFSAQAHQEGRSCLVGKMGTRVVSDKITLRDDGLAAEGMPLAFDFEGVPRKRLTLVENGVAKDLPHSTRTARKAGVESTGHSFGPLSSQGGLPLHLVLEPGDSSVKDMIASTDRGLLVSRFWYTNVAEPAGAVITGMTRDGLFLVEGGKLRKAAHNMRFTESVLGALSRVEAIGSELVGIDGWVAGLTRCPALKIAGFRFTGATEF